MPVETRYLRSDQQTVNGLTAYILGVTQSNLSAYKSISAYSGDVYVTQYLGIRVWRRASDGTETEITYGTPVAIASGSDSGLIWATWFCPATPLAPTDAIVIRVYGGDSSPPTNLLATYISEQLGANRLDSATWTVYYYLLRTYNARYDITTYSFYFGTTTYNSRIEGFSWSVPTVTYTLTINVDKESGYIGDAFTFYGTLTQDGTPISGATVTLYKDDVSTGLTAITNIYGNYSITWTADTVGNHTFYTEATW